MTTMLGRIESELVKLWERRQAALDLQAVQAEARAKAEAQKAEARARLLPDVREREQAHNERVWSWLAEGLDLAQEERELRRDASKAFGRSRVIPLPVDLVAWVKTAQNRFQVFLRGPRDHASTRQDRARQLHEFAKEQGRRVRSMAGGQGSKYQGQLRAQETQNAARRVEGKPPEDNAMLITAEQARSV